MITLLKIFAGVVSSLVVYKIAHSTKHAPRKRVFHDIDESQLKTWLRRV
jgi:hypothetical protein